MNRACAQLDAITSGYQHELITTVIGTAGFAVPTANQTTGVARTAAVATVAVATTNQTTVVAVVTNAVGSPVMSARVSIVVVNLMELSRATSCAYQLSVDWHCRGTEGSAKSDASRG